MDPFTEYCNFGVAATADKKRRGPDGALCPTPDPPPSWVPVLLELISTRQEFWSEEILKPEEIQKERAAYCSQGIGSSHESSWSMVAWAGEGDIEAELEHARQCVTWLEREHKLLKERQERLQKIKEKVLEGLREEVRNFKDECTDVAIVLWKKESLILDTKIWIDRLEDALRDRFGRGRG